MMTKSPLTNPTPVLTLALSLALAGSLLAQSGPRGSRNGREGRPDPVGRFDATAPEIGDLMPDLTVYDRNGQELRLRQLLTGHTTVLVLGCLT